MIWILLIGAAFVAYFVWESTQEEAQMLKRIMEEDKEENKDY